MRGVSVGEMVSTLAPRDERYVFAALDELIAENILVSDRAHYRFAHARAEEAHLYAWTGTDLRLVSSTGSGVPPSSVETLIHGAAALALSEATADRTLTVGEPVTESALANSALMSAKATAGLSAMVNSIALPPEANYQAFVLSHWNGERFVVVGALAVKMLPNDLCRLDMRSLAAAAAAMYARRDEAPTAIRRIT
jgi:hypothetical protein